MPTSPDDTPGGIPAGNNAKRPGTPVARSDAWFCLLLVLFTGLQWLAIYCTPLDLSPDEAHYWEWSRRLDIAYYSKGPLVAWLIAASTAIFGHSAAAVRLPALACLTLLSIAFYIFLRRRCSAKQALVIWLFLRITLIFVQAGFVMTTDAPAALFGFLALAAAWSAVERESRGRQALVFWLLFGVCLGLGIWSKYTIAVFFPSLILLFAATPVLRRRLAAAGPLSAACVVALFVLPIVYWNAKNGWVNFAHNAGHMVQTQKSGFRPQYFFDLLGSQLGLAGPLLLAGMVLAVIHAWRCSRSGLYERFLLSMILPLALLVVAVSFTKRVYANWPLPVYLAGLLLLGRLWTTDKVFAARIGRFVFPALALNALISIAAHLPLTGATFGIAPALLPTKKLAGWRELGPKVEEQLARFSPPFFLAANDYGTASAVSFYSPSHFFVHCLNTGFRRMNQYDIWTKPDDWQALRGADALLIFKEREEAAALAPHFARIEEITPSPFYTVEYGGQPIRRFYFFRGIQFDGRPPTPPQAR